MSINAKPQDFNIGMRIQGFKGINDDADEDTMMEPSVVLAKRCKG